MLKVEPFFEILTSLLREIGANEATEWVVVGDGADWIWGRVPELIEALDFDESKVTQIVDFYHVTERLYKISSEFCGLSSAERQKWVVKMKRFLHRDRVEDIINQKTLFKGRGAKGRRKLFDYFVEHAERMRYGTFRKQGYPLGSGAVESCVRRVVNLRLKGNGIFWTMESAEEVLHLRAQLLCGRWDEFVQTILCPSETWNFEGSDGYQACQAKGLLVLEGRNQRKQTYVTRLDAQAS
jgi:hypothetical protein